MIVEIQITGLTLKVFGLGSGKARASVWGFGPIISAFQCGNFSGSQELKSDHKTLGSKSYPPQVPGSAKRWVLRYPRVIPVPIMVKTSGIYQCELTIPLPLTELWVLLSFFLLLVNYGCTPLPAVQSSKGNP